MKDEGIRNTTQQRSTIFFFSILTLTDSVPNGFVEVIGDVEHEI